MSSPPEYQSLTQRDPDDRPADSKFQHVYPPDSAPTNGESSGTSGDNLTTVNYTFVPRYPITGKTQDALGLLYPDREATAEALQRIFPLLGEYDLDRIEILAQIEVTENDTRWGVIQDEAWPHITSKQTPKRLKVQVKDGPGDEKRRTRHECITALTICGCILGTFCTVLFVVFLIVGNK